MVIQSGGYYPSTIYVKVPVGRLKVSFKDGSSTRSIKPRALPRRRTGFRCHSASQRVLVVAFPWRGSQVVRPGSAKAPYVGSIPTPASFHNCKCSSVLRRGGSENGHQMDTKISTLGALFELLSRLVCYSLTLRKSARLRLRLRRSHENTLPSHSPWARPRELLLCRFQNGKTHQSQ